MVGASVDDLCKNRELLQAFILNQAYGASAFDGARGRSDSLLPLSSSSSHPPFLDSGMRGRMDSFGFFERKDSIIEPVAPSAMPAVRSSSSKAGAEKADGEEAEDNGGRDDAGEKALAEAMAAAAPGGDSAARVAALEAEVAAARGGLGVVLEVLADALSGGHGGGGDGGAGFIAASDQHPDEVAELKSYVDALREAIGKKGGSGRGGDGQVAMLLTRLQETYDQQKDGQDLRQSHSARFEH